MSLYLPSRDDVISLARRAELRNQDPNARGAIVQKVEQPPADWDERTVLTVPGVVWSISSDTCMTGRLSAPDNIAYDIDFREFVSRQPRNQSELGAIMSADSEEAFSCYRFDGLARWTKLSVQSWYEDLHITVGYIQHRIHSDDQMDSSPRAHGAYLVSEEFRTYLKEFRSVLTIGNESTAELAGRDS